MKKLCFSGTVEGRVQGVFFRASARRKALALGLSGWVENLPDGKVAFMACGEAEPLETFLTWLKKGPPAAKVTRLNYTATDYQDFSDFSKR